MPVSGSTTGERGVREHIVGSPDGRDLHVYEGGAPDGVPVFTLNGTPSAGLLHEPHHDDARRRGVRLLGYDRPGYGASTSLPDRDVAAAAADVAAIADALGIERFAVWGTSGGGPHTLACAALLGDRVVAAASLSGSAPYAAEQLDWMDGMGKRSISKFVAAAKGRQALEPMLLEERDAMIAGGAQALAEAGRTMLTPVDAAVMTGELADYLFGATRAGIEDSVDGWVDDILAFSRPWGFDVRVIAVPVLLWHGEHDGFVPVAHGAWLAERIPGVEARLSPDEGHLTLVADRIPEVHAWLAERF